MTREQEIIQEFVSRTDDIIKESIKKHPRFAERRIGFIDGAQWADRTMIEKAVKWLERYASDYAFSIYDEDDACSVDDDRLIEDFKRAMEG